MINLYQFDQALRQSAWNALEQIEIAVRVNLAYQLGRYAPDAHQHKHYFDNKFDHSSWLQKHEQLMKRATHSDAVKHHRQHYTAVPIWVCCEEWDFGAMSKLYSGLQKGDKDTIAKLYRLKSKQLQTHLHAFNFIRNIAAHHGRLWNRAMVFKANIKGLKSDYWQKLQPETPFMYFCLMKRMLDIICPDSEWGKRFLHTLDHFPYPANGAVYLAQMGVIFPPREWSLWQ